VRVIDYFDKSVDLNARRPALLDGDTEYSFEALHDLTLQLARALRAQGLKDQEPIAIFSPNDASILVCLLGLWRANAVWIPVNQRNALDANIQYMNYVRVGWLFYHSSFAEDAAKIRAAVPSIHHTICLDRAHGDAPSLDDFLGAAPASGDEDFGDAYGRPKDLVGIIGTGGTTGPAKGVRVTNLAWGTMMETAMNAWKADGDLVCLTTAPMTHAAGPVATVALAMGAKVVVMPKFDALGVLENIERHGVTHMFLPPTALYSMLAHPRVKDFDYSSLKVFLLAGSPVSPERFKEAVEVFGPCMAQSYGQTELPMIATWLPPETVAAAAADDHPERLGSCGRATQSVRVGIMNDDGKLLPVGEVGEIVARGSLVCDGYFELPEATAEIRTYGWHHTGDVGYRDAEGYFYIVDRKKDMIVTGGFNVFSAEVEATIMELAGVRECAVIGVPDPKWGEAVTAIIALASGAAISADQVIAHCKARLGSVKAPKAVHFWPEVPRTAAGKFDKKAMRTRFWEHTDRNVH
jgi:fatty-acyl-CoA synthase